MLYIYAQLNKASTHIYLRLPSLIFILLDLINLLKIFNVQFEKLLFKV
jgi:hypothetical protein